MFVGVNPFIIPVFEKSNISSLGITSFFGVILIILTCLYRNVNIAVVSIVDLLVYGLCNSRKRVT